MSDHRVILADCREGLASLPDRCIDVCLMDPPYSEWTHAKVRRGGSFHAADRTDGGPKRPVISTSVVLGFDALDAGTRADVAGHLARVVKRWIVVFSDAESVHLWNRDLAAAGAEHVRTGAWEKLGGTPQFTGDRPGIGFEAIEIAHGPRESGRMRWNGGGRPALWAYSVENGPGRVHPTQKPLALMEALVRDFTDPGDLILDAFCGSGTTGVACKRLGRRFLGFERDPRHVEAARDRIASAREQLGLFREKVAEPKQAGLALGAASASASGGTR